VQRSQPSGSEFEIPRIGGVFVLHKLFDALSGNLFQRIACIPNAFYGFLDAVRR